MRKLLFLMILLLAISIGCTKEREIIVVVPNVEVQFNMKQFFNIEEGSLLKSATTRSSYVHEYPASYTAYFVANETKGDYTAGQLIKTINVVKGLQSVVLPKLEYKVYVTNYSLTTAPSWYTWPNAIDQMPMASNTLYLYGTNIIDYKVDILGEVEVKNPYAAVMIYNYRIPVAPKHYDTNTDYISTGEGWWLKYIRTNTTNTGIVVEFTNESKVITINDPIVANKVYKYTLLADVPETDTEDNFNVEVEEFEEIIDREVEIW